MKLPNNSIGISDILDWQECARRMSFGMKRHGGNEAPEAANKPSTWYGSAFHDGVEHLEATGATDEETLQYLISNGHRWLDIEAMEHLRNDFEVYRTREPLGVRTVMNEQEIRVPLFVHNGTQIYYRARIDRLYQSLANPGVFTHRDYKSGAWPKTEEEVHKDKQMSAYNWALYEWMPEIEILHQEYDQLQFGVIPTSRTEAQRAATKDWLIKAVTAILEDDDVGPDGLGVPSFNKWCKFCPIMESCPVIPELSKYALAEIAVIAPAVKEGRKTVVQLDPELFDVYVAELGKAMEAAGVLEKFIDTVKEQLKLMPRSERERFGFELRSRNVDTFSVSALKAAHNLLGDTFYEVVNLTKTGLERKVSDQTTRELIAGMGDKRKGSPFVVRKGMGRKRGEGRGPGRSK